MWGRQIESGIDLDTPEEERTEARTRIIASSETYGKFSSRSQIKYSENEVLFCFWNF